MSTKYILVGGRPWKAPDGGNGFCEELAKNFDRPVKILECLFARPQESWQKSFEEDKIIFEKFLGEEVINLKMAELDDFSEQVKWSDVIYIRGGMAEDYVLDLFRKNNAWQNHLEGKTLAGSSAGADIISKYFYNLDNLKFQEGLGMLPLKVIVHWKSDYNAPNIDWDKAYDELKAYGEELPIVTLKEGEFKVF